MLRQARVGAIAKHRSQENRWKVPTVHLTVEGVHCAVPWERKPQKGTGVAPTSIVAESVQILLIAVSISSPGRLFGERRGTRAGVRPLL